MIFLEQKLQPGRFCLCVELLLYIYASHGFN